MTRIAMIVILATVAACTSPQGALLRDVVADRGRAEAAAGLENAEWWICRASPVGAIRDRYGRTEATAEAWNTLCAGQDGVNVIAPEVVE